jgi:hypothetical protein
MVHFLPVGAVYNRGISLISLKIRAVIDRAYGAAP